MMDCLALIYGVIFMQLVQGGTIWDYLARVITNSQEVLEDAEGCGILGAVTSRTRSSEIERGSDGCLSDCTWKDNPFYKTVDVHHSKMNDRPRSAESSFQYLYTSPKIPTDLNCLSDCFAEYQPGTVSQELEDLRLNCSANGLDTLIPTSSRFGQEFIASNYSDLVLWYEVTFHEFKGLFLLASRDPRLDCFLYSNRFLRIESDQVSNFIESDSVDGVAGSSDTSTLFDTSNTDVTRFLFRASTALQTAIEICALAKRQSRLKALKDTSPNLQIVVEDLFGSETCDHFLPDIFEPVSCRCVGTCASTTVRRSNGLPKNHLDHFAATGGLIGCQNACQDREGCEFFTLSHKNGGFNVPICWLWKSCTQFRIPDKSTSYYNKNDKTWVISDHWSAPRDCSEQRTTSCPLLKCKATEYNQDTVKLFYHSSTLGINKMIYSTSVNTENALHHLLICNNSPSMLGNDIKPLKKKE